MSYTDSYAEQAAAEQATATIAGAHAAMRDVSRPLGTALGQAGAYLDANLSPEGLQVERERLAAAARAAAGPRLEQLRAQVLLAAQVLSRQAAAALPKAGTDANATAQTAARWQAALMILTAGKPLRDVLATADVATLHALAQYGPSWEEARTYRPPTLGEALNPGPAPDHGPLMRSVDARLAALAGPKAVAALAAAREANAVRAGIEVKGNHLAAVIAGTATRPDELSVALAAADAEQAAREGLSEQAPVSDTAPAAG